MAFEAPGPDDERWLRCFTELRPALLLTNEAALSHRLHELVAEGAERECAVVSGLLHAMLHEPCHTARLFYQLCCCARDGLAFAIAELEAFALWRYPRLAQGSRQQLLVVLSKLIESRAMGAERLVVALLRHAGTGDHAQATLWLDENLLSLLVHHRAWLLDAHELVPAVLLSLLRLAVTPFAAS